MPVGVLVGCVRISLAVLMRVPLRRVGGKTSFSGKDDQGIWGNGVINGAIANSLRSGQVGEGRDGSGLAEGGLGRFPAFDRGRTGLART